MKAALARMGAWWRRPITRRERVRSACIGAVAGIWIGLFAFMLVDGGPISLAGIGTWLLSGVAGSAGLAALFPRVLGIVLFPLSICGIGN